MKRIIYLLVIATFIGCKHDMSKVISKTEDNICETENDVYEECSCPPTIYLQPLNGFSQFKAKRVKEQIRNSHIDIFNDVDIEILPDTTLGETMLNKTKTRYRADKIINSYRNKANKHYVIIGLTNSDISTTYKGKDDWGVLGLSFKKKYVGVVSTYRLKNSDRDFWKIVVHEFIHAYFGYEHCPKDNKDCIMQDAKGHANFSDKNNLCEYCKSQL